MMLQLNKKLSDTKNQSIDVKLPVGDTQAALHVLRYKSHRLSGGPQPVPGEDRQQLYGAGDGGSQTLVFTPRSDSVIKSNNLQNKNRT